MTTIKFLKNWIVYNGKKIKVRYSAGSYTPESGIPEGTITIYAKEYGNQLPQELNPQNDTDYQTDYFDRDKARITPDSEYYDEVKRWAR